MHLTFVQNICDVFYTCSENFWTYSTLARNICDVLGTCSKSLLMNSALVQTCFFMYSTLVRKAFRCIWHLFRKLFNVFDTSSKHLWCIRHLFRKLFDVFDTCSKHLWCIGHLFQKPFDVFGTCSKMFFMYATLVRKAFRCIWHLFRKLFNVFDTCSKHLWCIRHLFRKLLDVFDTCSFVDPQAQAEFRHLSGVRVMPPPAKCFVCFEPGRDGRCQWCSGCKRLWYCCRECQRAHWPDHRHHCTRRTRKLALREFRGEVFQISSSAFFPTLKGLCWDSSSDSGPLFCCVPRACARARLVWHPSKMFVLKEWYTRKNRVAFLKKCGVLF